MRSNPLYLQKIPERRRSHADAAPRLSPGLALMRFLTGTGHLRNGWRPSARLIGSPRIGEGNVDVKMQPTRPRLRVMLASPRGFCAGVSRAIQTVEEALAEYGAPVYVRHQIVHNAHVVRRLETMGAVFVDEVAQAPRGRPLIFSAHGSPAAAL